MIIKYLRALFEIIQLSDANQILHPQGIPKVGELPTKVSNMTRS
jgi:hypothetical protein